MGWIRVEDNFYDNPKIIAAGAHGMAVWIAAMGWCNRNLTDGIIPTVRSRQLVDFTGAAILTSNFSGEDGSVCADHAVQTLVAVDLFHENGHDCLDCVQPPPGCYVIHDYLKYQPSKAQVEEKAEANRERVRKWSEKRQSTNAVTNALATPELTDQLHDNPNPNPNPSTSSVVTKGGEVTKRNAQDAPPPLCSKHGETNSDAPCMACKRRREWQQEQDAARELDELDERRRMKELRDNCPTCQGTNLIDVSDGEVIKCDHQAAAHA
jgi:hypothetical protein